MSDLPKPTPSDPTPPSPVRPETFRGFLENWLLNQMSERYVGKDRPKYQQLMENEILDLAVELAGPFPSPIEQTLAMTAATCWADLRMLQSQEQSTDSRTIAQADHQQRRTDRAHRRYLSTLRLLAQVRRLALPTVQVNVAHQQQVNNGGSA